MQEFMITLINCSITMSLLAVFYIALTPLLERRYSGKGRYYAWLIIVVGLIIPFRPRFHHAIITVNIPERTVMPIFQTEYEIPLPAFTPGKILPSAAPDLSLWSAAAWVWFSGMMVFLCFHMIKYYRFRKMTARWREQVECEHIFKMFQRLKSEMKVKRAGLYVCPCIGSPMLTGLLKSDLLLPHLEFAQDEMELILKHELVHLKRKDLWFQCLVLAATAIHWFNPMVYLIGEAIATQCEMSCDSEVIQGTDENTRRRYSETIIGVAKHRSIMKTILSTDM